jgi:hypothetical protein
MSFNLGDIWSYEDKTRNLPSIQVVRYPTIHYQDWFPVSVINPNFEKGPWIAGGAGLRWYQGIPVGESDIDVYCSSPMQAEQLQQKIFASMACTEKYKSDNAVTLEVSKDDQTWTVQIIKKNYFTDMQKVIDSFDLSVCQVATDGNTYLLGNHTAKDIRERNLRMRMPLQADALKRLIKYWTYGYRPVDGLLEAIQHNPVGRWEFNPAEDYL